MKIKKCPICCSKKIKMNKIAYGYTFICQNCNTSGPMSITKKGALDQQNTRSKNDYDLCPFCGTHNNLIFGKLFIRCSCCLAIFSTNNT